MRLLNIRLSFRFLGNIFASLAGEDVDDEGDAAAVAEGDEEEVINEDTEGIGEDSVAQLDEAIVDAEGSSGAEGADDSAVLGDNESTVLRFDSIDIYKKQKVVISHVRSYLLLLRVMDYAKDTNM